MIISDFISFCHLSWALWYISGSWLCLTMLSPKKQQKYFFMNLELFLLQEEKFWQKWNGFRQVLVLLVIQVQNIGEFLDQYLNCTQWLWIDRFSWSSLQFKSCSLILSFMLSSSHSFACFLLFSLLHALFHPLSLTLFPPLFAHSLTLPSRLLYALFLARSFPLCQFGNSSV